MFNIILPNKNIKTISNDDIIHELYYNLAVLDIYKYNEDELQNAKKNISLIDTEIPLFDIFSKNIYLINAENVYSRVIFHNYRIPDIKIIKLLKKTLLHISESKININKYYIEKINKNLNFINNYDLDVLYNTYFKVFYLSQPLTSELTNCIKPSFIPFLTSKPYYTKSELINLALNMNLKIDINNIDSENICSLVSDNDITAQEILSHQIYIKENIAKSYIQLYTLLGSYYWNFYLRNECLKDIFLEKQIHNLYSIISKAPKFNKDYWLYRFIENDNYLSHLKINDFYEEKSFISTTRNPFYDPKNNLFGFILIKIKIPKHIEGVGLCIESYSMFPNEEEILLNPSCLKLISINENFNYYHPNDNAAKRIKKLYVFEYVNSISINFNILNYKINTQIIPKINWLEDNLEGDDFASKVYYFYRIILPIFNNKRYFYSDIGQKTYLFQAFYLDDNPVYEKYFFLQKKELNAKKDEIYFILQNENSGEIEMLIELRDIISVNYIHRFLGSRQEILDEDFIKFLSSLGKYFGIDEIIIHNSYKSYKNIADHLLQGTDENIINEINPDNHIISLYSGDFTYYNEDLINFLENNKIKYNNIPGIKYNLKKHHIVFLSKIDAKDVFNKIEKTPLYNILIKSNKIKLLDFYLYIHYNFFYLLPELNQLIAFYNNDIFINIESNPWLNSYFILKYDEYLYERKYINFIKTFKTNIFQDYLYKLAIENNNISFNKYRIGLL